MVLLPVHKRVERGVFCSFWERAEHDTTPEFFERAHFVFERWET